MHCFGDQDDMRDGESSYIGGKTVTSLFQDPVQLSGRAIVWLLYVQSYSSYLDGG